MSAVVSRIDRGSATPGEMAEDAAEALRALNHLTLAAPSAGVPGWEGVGDVYRVLGDVRVLADRVPQMCDQLATALERIGDRAEWRTDGGADQPPDVVAAAAVEALGAARCIAEDLGRTFGQAHCAVSHLSQ